MDIAIARVRPATPTPDRSRRRPSALLALLLTAVVVAAGCGGTSDASERPDPSGPVSGDASPTATPRRGPPTRAPSGRPSAGASAAPSFETYEIQGGDTLQRIADRLETTWQSLVFWNKDQFDTLNPASGSYDPGQIQAGWRLRYQRGVIVDDDPDGAAGVPEPTLAPPTPTSGPGGPAAVVERADGATGQVALTFDLDGRVEPALPIMRWLIANKVRATIFVTGELAQTRTGREVLTLIEENGLLFDLGNAGYSQVDLRPMGLRQLDGEIRRAEDALGAQTQRSARPFFRPPLGSWDDEVRTAAGAIGYSRIVLWDVDPLDWRTPNEGGPTATELATRVSSAVRDGSIVHLHLGGHHTLTALPDIVAQLGVRGLTPVTLRQLLRT